MAAFLAIPVVAGEIVVRKLVSRAIAGAVKNSIGISPTVGFGSSPVLLQIVHGRLNAVTLDASGARIDGLPPTILSATLHDVHMRSLTSLQGAIGSLTLDARLSGAGARALLATPACVQSLPSTLLHALTAHPRALIFPGRIDLLPPAGRAAEIQFHPYAAGQSVEFAIVGLYAGGVAASSAQLTAARSQTRCSRSLGNLPFGVSLRAATAQAGNLDLHFAGRGASFSALG
jgi:hypothetical protein